GRPMPDDAASRAARARSAPADDLAALVHEDDEAVLLALLENPSLAEPHLTVLLERLDLTARVVEAIAAEKKWTAKEGIRLRLARHPRTPRRTALTLLRQLFLFDLVRLSLLPSAPADIRRMAEEVVITRIPHVPVGEKLTLARRGPARVAGAVLAEGHPQGVKLALSNSFLTESQVLKVLAKPGVPERVVVAVAQHSKWAIQYNVRVALLRNPHTPVASLLKFLPNLTLRDLKDVARLENLAPHLKRYLQQELTRRMHAAGKSDPRE
ncbi:MAG: hypothetical protein WAJ92_06195, partial [Candidatus Acidiferrales bacterium]